MRDAAPSVERAFRAEWPAVVAHLIRTTGDRDLAEDCAQDAFARALVRWERDGVPRNPGAWLMTTAHHRALDHLRRAAVGTAKLQEVGMAGTTDATDHPDSGTSSGIEDDRLRMIFTCCHPALPAEAQVALTLRIVAGLTTAEVARAFLVPNETMTKRLVRAKGKIRDARIPYRVPPPARLPERKVGVLAVVYAVFNEGYSAAAGADPVRQSLCTEAIRLGRLLRDLMPREPEVLGLLALMLLHDSRRRARLDATGEPVPLERQDRGRWDAAAIAEGCDILADALRLRDPGPYQIQAAIAACHCIAPTAAATDWRRIASLYGRLAEMVPSPVVLLNRAVAVAMAAGPEAGLQLVVELEASEELPRYHLLPATRADLLRRLGRAEEAAIAYREALLLAPTEAERRPLARRLMEVEVASDGAALVSVRRLPVRRLVGRAKVATVADEAGSDIPADRQEVHQ